MQTLIVTVLVAGCSAYTLWTLMPAGARRALAAGMLRIPHLPRRIETRLQKAAQAPFGCGCDGCDRSDKKPAAKTLASRTITFHPRPRR